jgi:archaellum component FlaC
VIVGAVQDNPWVLFAGAFTTFFTGVVLGVANFIRGARQAKVTDALTVSQQQLQAQTTERDYQSRIIVEQADYIERLETRNEKMDEIVEQLRKELRELRIEHDECNTVRRELRDEVNSLRRRVESSGR